MDISFLGKLAPPGGTPDADEFVKNEILMQEPETIPAASVDYQIGGPQEDNKLNPSLSYAQIQTEEEGVDWYRNHHPEYPDGVLRIMSRASFGTPADVVPNLSAKRIAPRRKKVQFSITPGEHVIVFD